MSTEIGYYAEYRDWAGGWVGVGYCYPSAREARDACIAGLASNGYSGADVRVLRMRTDRTLEVVPAAEVSR